MTGQSLARARDALPHASHLCTVSFMGIQIAVHLPPELVKSLDALVASGGAQSRASVIEQALTRELRYRRKAQEVEILNSGGGADLDLDSLTRFVSGNALDID